ncbi:hypothetical protein GUITHDRAFT_109069 [Guillardia theta CCMP2712]|uniref:DNL-type domain-containing protein n=1 Tax=Guillardia theta (strain CCMP2712) TaxID=905079 RepID=L1JA99_GUITC|nr:hypothetical protein GUITHDRAFT_109069 [Guillardia theta CCMP2712]EKX45024.1 hypothetical protein GUITHDRAFT_109069 [Guillardia theta CCMP2712]|eukprot:XP_005832004.1 hypothetical protein GUITHDRAFT_109069 [Guillardia theta CCMP2712]
MLGAISFRRGAQGAALLMQERSTMACSSLRTMSVKSLRRMHEAGGGFQRRPGENAGELRSSQSSAEEDEEYKKARMAIAFTCKTCETRVFRSFSKRAYEKGVVIIRVEQKDGCNRQDGGNHCLHLIADNLGWFEDRPVNVETFMLAREGQKVQRLVLRTSENDRQLHSESEVPAKDGAADKVFLKTDDGQTVEFIDDSK